jgi:2-methylisocitrate lyase-like PEP mutase family enzyme
VVDASDWLAKLRAVIDLRTEGIDLFVVARTDARSAVSLEEAITRAKAARDVGADAIFVEAPESLAELETVAREVEGVVRVANMIEGGRTPLLSPQELHELGYDLIVTPLSGLLAAARALEEVYSLLREAGTLRDHMDKLTPFPDFAPVVALEAHRMLEERYRDVGD